MDNLKLRNFIQAYREGNLTEQQCALLEDWYIIEGNKIKDMSSEIDYMETELRIWEKLAAQHNIEKKLKTRILWSKISIAATVAVIMFGAYLFNYRTNSNLISGQAVLINDIAPGKTGATLTLSNGKKIRLSDAVNGELANESGVSISKSSDGKLIYKITENINNPNKINILSTANGETYELRLPDGSLVILNAASSLEYPTNFNTQKERRVKLNGEGYFKIAKDKAHPFIVQTEKQEVEVLGTQFNINAYDNEPVTRTTLLEGSVRVTSAGTLTSDPEPAVLKPGQISISNGDKIQLEAANLETELAWKNGDFIFNGENFESILRKIERWYNVDIIYKEGSLKNMKIGGTVSRSKYLSSVLAALELTGKIKFKAEGRRISVIN